MSSWLSTQSANRYLSTYFNGFVDISGGQLILRNGDAYFNGNLVVGKNLTIQGQTSLNGNSLISRIGLGTSSVNQNYVLDISGESYIKGNLYINKDQTPYFKIYNKSSTFNYSAMGFTLVGTSSMYNDTNRGYVFNFNGSSYYRLNTSPVNTASTTLGFWIYYTGQTTQNIICSTWWPVYYNATGKLASTIYYTGNGPELIESTAKTINTWHHYTITVSSSFVTLYVDGVLDTSANFAASYTGWSRVSSTNPNYANDGFIFGGGASSPIGASPNLNGLVDDVRVYGYTLSPKQVLYLYYESVRIYALDVSGNVNIQGLINSTNGIIASATQTIDFSNNAPIMSGANIAAGTIPASAVSGVSGTYVDLTTNQTVGGVKTFSSAPVMSGASITAGTIPASAIGGGLPYVDLSNNQTVGGVKTFSSLLTASGGLTVSGGTVTLPGRSITDGALSTNVALLNGTNTFSGSVSFSTATPTAPTPSTSDSTTKLATTAYVQLNLSLYLTTSTAASTYLTTSTAASTYLTTSTAASTYLTTSTAASTYLTTSNAASTYAPLASPPLSGTPTAPTAASFSDTTQIATTAYVKKYFIDLSNNQTVDGVKKFSSPPVMSGASITAGTIPASALSGGGSYVDLSTDQTVGGAKKFSNSMSVGKNSITSGYSLDISGNVIATSYNATSDRRLKDNIEPMESQWFNILSINPVSFDWKLSGKSDTGFIAQDIHSKYPYLKPDYSELQDPESSVEEPIDLSGNPLYYAIDYGRMTPFLWKGVQETMREIDSLKTENEQLKYLIHGLSQRISSLEYR